jgi:hypothetical protein
MTDENAEPVAWMRSGGAGSPVVTEEFLRAHPEYRHEYVLPLYAAPTQPQRKPLTDEEIDDILWPSHQIMQDSAWYIREFARAIERAHGIGGRA